MQSTDFSEIVRSTKTIVLSAIQKNLAERFNYAIDDVVQETYLRAFKALENGNFKGESKISTYLYTIAKNEALRANYYLEREEKKIDKLKSKPILSNESSDTSLTNIDSLLTRIKMLPDHYSHVIQKKLDGKSEKEISKELGITQGTVKSRISRAKGLLKKLFKDNIEYERS
jgi:RNA polymerase sigma-70 factor, ECF subfamily